MNQQQLTEFLAQRGLKIDDFRAGAGKFRDIYTGTGQISGVLHEVTDDLRCRGVSAQVARVTNREHPDFGKSMVEIESFWWDEQPGGGSNAQGA